MDEIVVKLVQTAREKRIFLTFPWQIFNGDPLWVPPLLPELRDRLNPRKGVFFRRSETALFIAWRGRTPVGTICAWVDREANEVRKTQECIFGFFNFIEDYAVFESLLKQVREWAVEKSLNVISGPFNLDYEDGYGVLIEGRDRPPTLLCGHTPAYYAPFYERYGFQPLRGDNIAFALDLTVPNPALDELSRMAARVRERGRFTIRPADLSHWEDEIDRICCPGTFARFSPLAA
jgi:hypothetical protein